MNQSSRVAVVKADDIEEAVNKSIDLIGGLDDLPGKKLVCIKPNLCGLKSSSSGQTTDPRIVETIIKKVNSVSTSQIYIVESNNSQASADETFKTLGYKELEEKYPNVKCVNLSKDAKVKLSLNGEIFSTISVPETMLFSDYLINVAKLKTHVDYYFTGALKNAYGFLTDRSARPLYHGFMREALVDLNKIYQPNLCVIDGVIGMEGFGPTDGNPKHVGVIIASKDPVAADSVASRIVGIKPSQIGYLRYAEKKGLGKFRDIEVVGCNMEEVKTKFAFIPKKWFYIGRLSLSIQRYSIYCSNFARFLSLVRSSLSTIGFSTLEKRASIGGLVRLAKDTIFKIDG
jgi:uncharacterized protein (DUF362 family)